MLTSVIQINAKRRRNVRHVLDSHLRLQRFHRHLIIIRQRDPQTHRSVKFTVKVLDDSLAGNIPGQRGWTQASGESCQIDKRIQDLTLGCVRSREEFPRLEQSRRPTPAPDHYSGRGSTRLQMNQQV